MSIVEVKNLSTQYFTEGGIVRAVESISLKLRRGSIIGLAGESGSGKSTLALSIMKLLPGNGEIVQGEIIFVGLNIVEMSESEIRKKIRWSIISMVFQGALNALNPLHRIGDQIAEPIILHKGISTDNSNNQNCPVNYLAPSKPY